MERTDFEQWKAKEVARLLALVEGERRYYQEMVASLPAALVVLSEDRSIVSANRAFRRTFNLRTDDLRRKTIEQILPSPRLVERIRDVHLHGAAERNVFVEIADRTFRIGIVPMRNWDDEGEVETLLMVEDTSGMVAAPSLPAPIDQTADIPAIVWHAEAATLSFTSVDGAVESMLGYPAAHWLDTPQFFSERIHPEDREATLDYYRAAIERGGDASAEFRAVSASGGVVWCRETIRVSGMRAIAGVMTGITLRKQLEEQWLAAQRSDALHGLASRLAHDLNNPLMIITGYGEETLHALQPQDPVRGDVEQILEATERISGITGQLLGFTRRLAAQPHAMDLCAALSAMEEKIARSAGASVAVEMTAARQPVWAMADAAQFEEIVLALVSGEREDARERSRLTISCTVETVDEQLPAATLKPGDYACVILHDNGRGMDAEKRAAVFESILAKDPGGPAIARAYSTVREWGGDIAFSSEPFRGSTFLVYLRSAEPEGAEAPAPAASSIPEPEAAAPAEEEPRATILLVEDEAGIRGLVRKILRRERYGVLEAASAEEALNIAAAHPGRVDLLVTDIMLPGMGGRELAQALLETRPDLKVVYVSGFTSDESVRAGMFPPGSKFLQKPFTLTSLMGRVTEALE